MTGLRERCEQVLEGSWTVGERDGVPFATRARVSGIGTHVLRRSGGVISTRRGLVQSWRRCSARCVQTGSSDTIFWEHPVSGPRALYYNVIHHDDAMTATIEPPALAFAWRLAVGGWRLALEPRIVAHHAAIAAERDLEGDGLWWILQSDESGLDALAQFDPIWGHRAQGLPGFVELVRRNREREFRIEAVRADGDPVVCEVLTNVIHGHHARGRRPGHQAAPVHEGAWNTVLGIIANLGFDVVMLWCGFLAIHSDPVPGFPVVIIAYIIGALGGSIPLPAAASTIGGMAGMVIVYGVARDDALAAVLLHQAIGLLVPLIGGAIAYTILRRRLGPIRPSAAKDPVDPGLST